MATAPLQLIIGNYNTSSWSLRAWLVLRLARLSFSETRVPLRRPDTPGRIAQFSPSGKLPVLLAEGVPVWDSLAIAEFVAELEPAVWPVDPVRRAEARSISAELHGGFADLRRLMPMDIVSRFSQPGRLPRGLAADIDRITAIWRHCRARHAADGPFLFGAYSVADAMMAPVATRFVTHGVPLDGAIEDYVDSLMSWPDMVTWCDAAAAEQSERERGGTLEIATQYRSGRPLGAAERLAPGRAVTAGDAIVQGSDEDHETSTQGPAALAVGRGAAVGRPGDVSDEPADEGGGEAGAAAGPSDQAALDAARPPPAHGPAGDGEARPSAASAPAKAVPGEERSAGLGREEAADGAGQAEASAAAPTDSAQAPVLDDDWPAWPARADAAGGAAGGEAPGGEPAGSPLRRRIGWLRNPVPPEHLGDEAAFSLPLRRAAESGGEPAPPTGAQRRLSLGGLLSAEQAPAERAAGPEARRPLSPARDSSRKPDDAAAPGAKPSPPAHGVAAPRRPAGPPQPEAPIKPIGGGTLRRR